MTKGHRALVTFAAVAVMTLTGCGGEAKDPQVASVAGDKPASTQPQSDAVTAYLEAARKYAQCMRDEGFDAADPDAKGHVAFKEDISKLKATSKFGETQRKCSASLPPLPKELQESAPVSEEEKKTRREYAKCMRENGAPDFPDPGPDGNYPEREDGRSMWNQGTPEAIRAGEICGPIVGAPASPGPGVG